MKDERPTMNDFPNCGRPTADGAPSGASPNFYAGGLAADGDALNAVLPHCRARAFPLPAFRIRPNREQNSTRPLQNEDEPPLIEVSQKTQDLVHKYSFLLYDFTHKERNHAVIIHCHTGPEFTVDSCFFFTFAHTVHDFQPVALHRVFADFREKLLHKAHHFRRDRTVVRGLAVPDPVLGIAQELRCLTAHVACKLRRFVDAAVHFVPHLAPFGNDFSDRRRKLMRRNQPFGQGLRLCHRYVGGKIFFQRFDEDWVYILVLPVTRPQGSH